MKTQLLFKTCYIMLLMFSNISFAQWATDPAVNNSICSFTGTQFQSVQVTDGNGGSIIVWTDDRNGDYDIYAQRIDVNGVTLWTTNGKPICSAIGNQRFPSVISDNQSGAIITWTDERNLSTSGTDIYAQRISNIGNTLWATNGVPICTAVNSQQNTSITSLTPSGNGGAIIVWEDKRNGTDWNIYAQSVNYLGVTQWLLDGILECSAPLTQKNPKIIAAEAGKSIIVWEDSRTATAVYDIYAKKINSTGSNDWATVDSNGAAICTATSNQIGPNLVTDGNFGAIITWYDYRNGSNYDIYAQEITSSGAMSWTANGISICVATGDQTLPQICTDGANGAIIAWEDARAATSDIYLQRVNASGVQLWGTNGESIISTVGNQIAPSITSDNTGGAIVSWTDYRIGTTNADIYCQRVDGSGLANWNGNYIIGGVAVCTEQSNQAFATSIISSNSGGAIIAWYDYRNSATNLQDVFAQRINPEGTLAVKTNDIDNQKITIYPNPSSNGEFFIQSKTEIQEVTAFDILGKPTDVEKNNDLYKINASNGVYTLKIIDSDGNTKNLKLIVK